MFTAKINKLNSHAQDDLRFCRVEGVVNHCQRLKDEEQLQEIYALRDAAVGVERIAIEAAIPILQNHMMLSSSVIMRHTTVVSQIVELSHDDIPGKYYFTGNGMAKAPDHERPWDAFWCANNFDLGWISPKLCHIQIYFRNTDAELFYKDFGFAYVTSNHGINPQSTKHNMIHDWGYRNEIFEYHYETEIFKKLRGNWDLSFLKQPLNTHYRLIKEAYDYRHLIAPSNYESNNTLLFNGAYMVLYPGKHPDATCSQYFDLSRVDPDARGITIYFFPGHEKTLYQEHGFAYIVGNAANNTPGGSRADLIKKFHNPLFATYYGHLPGRTYDITYPKKWQLEMAQVDYDWAIKKARQDAKHKKNMAIVKGVVGIGLGAFASTLVPGLGSQLLTAILRGAACGSVSSIVQGGNIAKGTLQGMLFAGLNHTLSSMSVLKDAKKLQDALRIGITAAISAEMNGENVFKSMLIAVGTDALVGQFMKSEGLTKQEALIRAFGISTVANVLGGQNLGNALMAGAIGAIGKMAEQTGEHIGNGVTDTIQENAVEKPKKRLAITDGSNDDKLNSDNKNNLVLIQNMTPQNTHTQNTNIKETKLTNDDKNISEKLARVKKELGEIDYNKMRQERINNPTLAERHLTFAKQQFSMTPERIQQTLESIPLIGVTKGVKFTTKGRINNHNANNVNAQKALNKKMHALQDAQKEAVKIQEFLDGRIRYYAKERFSQTPGPTKGSSFVTEYNPKTGQLRQWNESYDQFGNVNRIHPKMIDGQDIIGQHYPPTKTELQFFVKSTGKLK